MNKQRKKNIHIDKLIFRGSLGGPFNSTIRRFNSALRINSTQFVYKDSAAAACVPQSLS